MRRLNICKLSNLSPNIQYAAFLFAYALYFAAICSNFISAQNAARDNVEQQIQLYVKRLNDARASNRPMAVQSSSKDLIAYALRVNAKIEFFEAKYDQSISADEESLQYRDSPDTRLDIALTYMAEKKTDLAITSAKAALSADPASKRAANVLANAYIQSGKFSDAIALYQNELKLFPSDILMQYALGETLLSSGLSANKAEAKLVFQKMKMNVGDSGSLHVMFGRAYRDSGYMQDAVDEFKNAITINPRTPHAHYFLGLAYLSMNEWQPSKPVIVEFKQELINRPDDFLANYMLGSIESEQGNYADSNIHLQAAIKTDPSWPEPWLYLGLNFAAQNRKKQAEIYLKKSIKLTGENISRSDYIVRKAYIELGKLSMNEGNNAEAKKYSIIARQMQNKVIVNTQNNMAKSIAELGAKGSVAGLVPLADYRKSDADIDGSHLSDKQLVLASTQISRLNAVLGLAFTSLAVSYAEQGNCLKASTAFDNAIEWNGDNDIIEKNYGICAYKLGAYDAAVDQLSKYVKSSKDNAAKAILGMSYFYTNQYVNAINCFTELGNLAKRDPVLGYAWASSLVNNNQYNKAASILSEYERNNHTSPELLLAGRLWIVIGNYEKSIETFREILKQDRSFPKAHFDIGEAYMKSQKWNLAGVEFQDELKGNPEDIDAMYNLGYVDLQLANYAEAEKMFRNVISINPEYGMAQYQLGKILVNKGETENATKHLESAAKLLPDKDYVHYELQVDYRKLGRISDANRELNIYSSIRKKTRNGNLSGMGD